MSRTYKATGINLKSMPMGEADRLLTILTREFGLVRAVAMGSRKHNSSMGGRSGLFVVNDLLIAKGRSLDKVAQAETLESYPGLSQDLKKLTASHYLAELCLYQALSDQPQEELFCLLGEHLKRLERSSSEFILPHLTHAVFQLLVLAGIAPQVYTCCITRQSLTPDFADPSWRIGFSIPAGGTVTLETLATLRTGQPKPAPKTASTLLRATVYTPNQGIGLQQNQSKVAEGGAGSFDTKAMSERTLHQPPLSLHAQLTASELALLQQLAQANLPQSVEAATVWHSVERVLRHYAQYHFDRPIRSATLIDACFVSANHPLPP
jgi:DNA repair protein RecO (recombination protein O)